MKYIEGYAQQTEKVLSFLHKLNKETTDCNYQIYVVCISIPDTGGIFRWELRQKLNKSRFQTSSGSTIDAPWCIVNSNNKYDIYVIGHKKYCQDQGYIKSMYHSSDGKTIQVSLPIKLPLHARGKYNL